MDTTKRRVMEDIFKIQEILFNIEITGKDYHIRNIHTIIPVFSLNKDHVDFDSPRYLLYKKYPYDNNSEMGIFINDFFLIDDIIYSEIDSECDIIYKGNVVGKIDHEGSIYNLNGKKANLVDIIKSIIK